MPEAQLPCVRLEVRAFAIACGLGLWLALTMPVFAQEAYYWSYAQHPDLSYYDHPPMVAWLIWLGTHLFGNGALGLRLGTWLCSCATAWFGLVWLRDLGAGARARVAFLVCTFGVPLVGIAHFLTTPDPPLLCFWMATLVALWRARSGALRWWVAAGVAAGCALLSKYTAGFLAVGGLSVLLLDPRMRRQWRLPGPYVGVLVAALVFSPVVLWNVGNDFESFRFQTGRFGKAGLSLHWLAEFLGGQLLVLHPVLLALLPALVVGLWTGARRREPGSLWSLAFGLPMVAFFVGSALFIQVKINWLLPAAVPLLCAGLVAWERRAEALAVTWPRLVALAQRSVVAMGLVLVLLAPVVRFVPQIGGSSWSGWDEIAQHAARWGRTLDAEDGRPGNIFYFAPNYRDAAQLLRQLVLRAEQEASTSSQGAVQVLAQNALGEPALQFDHWASPEGRAGESAVFVMTRPERDPAQVGRLLPHFQSVQRVETVRVRQFGVLVATADVYACRGYLGPIQK